MSAQAKATKTWRNIELGTYRCAECGGRVVSLVERDATGHVILREEPLLCPYCARKRDYVWALFVVARFARSISELRKLVRQLLDFEIPAPYEGEEDE